jgi:hypothetical protein
MTPDGVGEVHSWAKDRSSVRTIDADGVMREWRPSQVLPMPKPTPFRDESQWALRLYRQCQKDAERDPWWEPGGAERRFLAKLREYAGDAE